MSISERRMRLRATFFPICLLLLSLLAAAQVNIPNTPAGKQFSAWLAAYNRGGDVLRQYLSTNFPTRGEAIGRDVQLSQMTGGFHLKKIEESSATKIVALVQERASDQFARVTMEVAPEAPHNIVHFQGIAIPPPDETAPPHLPEQQLISELRKKLESASAADGFSGAVLVAKNGKPVFGEAYGYADREKKTANALNTQFNIGSMNKMFTAIAVLQLAQAGKLDLHAPIGKYLTDYPNKDVASKVTIHHLLTHTGGAGDFFGPEYDEHRDDLRTLNNYVALFGKRGIAFEPGSKWEYSNYGFLLLGAIVERITGQTYYEYIHEHIYKPAGMNNTNSDPGPAQTRAIGYTKKGSAASRPELHPNTDHLPYRGTPAGGGYSTVEDLLKFAIALRENRLLNADYTALLTAGKVQTPMGFSYAYGFGVQTINGTLCYGHNGGGMGINGELQICPATGYVVAALANMDPPAAEQVVKFAVQRLPTE